MPKNLELDFEKKFLFCELEMFTYKETFLLRLIWIIFILDYIYYIYSMIFLNVFKCDFKKKKKTLLQL